MDNDDVGNGANANNNNNNNNDADDWSHPAARREYHSKLVIHVLVA